MGRGFAIAAVVAAVGMIAATFIAPHWSMTLMERAEQRVARGLRFLVRHQGARIALIVVAGIGLIGALAFTAVKRASLPWTTADVALVLVFVALQAGDVTSTAVGMRVGCTEANQTVVRWPVATLVAKAAGAVAFVLVHPPLWLLVGTDLVMVRVVLNNVTQIRRRRLVESEPLSD